MAERRLRQRQVLALLLAAGALLVPLAGAALFGGIASQTESDTAFLFLGAVSQYDFVPVLMLVGAFALLVGLPDRPGGRSPLALLAAGVVVAAGATLALAYLGSAYHLRVGGAFGLASDGSEVGWSSARVASVASLAMTGVLCGVVLVLAAMWMGDRKDEVVR